MGGGFYNKIINKMKNLNIRTAEKSDIDTLINLVPNNSSWNKNSFEQELKIKFSTIYLAELNNEIVACSVIWNLVDEIQLNQIVVNEKYRRKRIATELINYIIKLYKRNYKKILLEVNENNLPAIKLYESLYFKTTGRRKKYYKDDDAILMERSIE